MKYIKRIIPLFFVFFLALLTVSCTGRNPATDTITSANEMFLSETESYPEKGTETVSKKIAENKKRPEAATEVSETGINTVCSAQKESTAKDFGTTTKKETSKTVISEASQILPKETITHREYTSKNTVDPENSVSESVIELSSAILSDQEKIRITIDCSHAVKYGISTVPQSGIILDTQVVCRNGDTAMDVLKRALSSTDISLDESRGYVREIGGLKEKDCGSSSGWMYKVNSETPMTASDKYSVSSGDTVTFYYVTKYGDTV